MTVREPVVAVTGASGYLGSRICERFRSLGWRVVRLTRSPRPGDASERFYDLGGRPAFTLLTSVDVLVHAAYDQRLTRRADIWRVNVDGTQELLAAANEAGVGRVIVLSSMSAYEGTAQLYGQAKLDIEQATLAAGGVVVRPGLVYGDHPGGMVGALRRMTRLPLVPLVASQSALYPVHEDDITSAVVALASVEVPPSSPVCVARPDPVPFRSVLEALAAGDGRTCHFVAVPWRPIYTFLRLAEVLHLPLPFRADSLLGLVQPASSVAGAEEITRLGVELRKFAV